VQCRSQPGCDLAALHGTQKYLNVIAAEHVVGHTMMKNNYGNDVEEKLQTLENQSEA
jgi:hypothetical protein